MIAFRHHTRYARFRSPQGALPCGQALRIAGETGCGGEIASVTLRLWQDEKGETRVPMTWDGTMVSAEISMPETPGLLWYYFLIQTTDGQTFYYGGESGEGRLSMHEPQSFQVTVYDGAFTTPAWAREGIAYQIFPDRFKRSSWEDFVGRAQYHKARGRFLRLHDRWSEPVCSDPAPGQPYYMPDDFFGGDLNGIREKLPYLAGLGVTLLYLNPIFESPSNHRYDTADYNRVDPILGNEEELQALCREAGALDIRVMLDGVFSHTGADSRYFDKYHRFNDVGASESQDSAYYSWYHFDQFPDQYSCWWSFPELPNVDEMNPSYQEFLLGESGVLRRWANAGAKSWRLDVADELPDACIRNLRKRVKADDPEGFLLGEVWEDCSNKIGPEGRRGYVNGDELDGAMNYPFTNGVLGFLTGKMDAHGLNQALQTLREHYPRPFYEGCFNLLSSHDIVRAATALSGAPDRTALTRPQQATFRPSPLDEEKGKKRLVLATALQMAMPGIPCVYYGDEAGMTGMGDPFNRGTYPWGREDQALLAAFRALMHARRDIPALKRGLTRMGALSPEVFAVVRYLADGTGTALLLLNRSEREQAYVLDPESLAEGPDGEIPVPFRRVYEEALTGETLDAGSSVSGVLPPLTARLYIG